MDKLHGHFTTPFQVARVRDPNDELVLEAAINGRADALATYIVGISAMPHLGSGFVSCGLPIF